MHLTLGDICIAGGCGEQRGVRRGGAAGAPAHHLAPAAHAGRAGRRARGPAGPPGAVPRRQPGAAAARVVAVRALLDLEPRLAGPPGSLPRQQCALLRRAL